MYRWRISITADKCLAHMQRTFSARIPCDDMHGGTFLFATQRIILRKQAVCGGSWSLCVCECAAQLHLIVKWSCGVITVSNGRSGSQTPLVARNPRRNAPSKLLSAKTRASCILMRHIYSLLQLTCRKIISKVSHLTTMRFVRSQFRKMNNRYFLAYAL